MSNRSLVFRFDPNSPLTLWIDLLDKVPRLILRAIKGDLAALEVLSEPTLSAATVRADSWNLANRQEPTRVKRGWTREDETRVVIDKQLRRGFRPPTRVDRLIERIQPIRDMRLHHAIHEARIDGTAKVLSQLLHESEAELNSLMKLAKEREWDSSKPILRAYSLSDSRLSDHFSEFFKWAKPVGVAHTEPPANPADSSEEIKLKIRELRNAWPVPENLSLPHPSNQIRELWAALNLIGIDAGAIPLFDAESLEDSKNDPKVRRVYFDQFHEALRIAYCALSSSISTERNYCNVAAETTMHIPSRREQYYKWLVEAMFLVKDNPELPDAEIARRVGRNRSTLSRDKTYQIAAATARGSKEHIRRGRITVDPDSGLRDIEAYTDDPAERDWDD